MRHVIWDWNGTLFDDLHLVVEAVNESLALFGADPIDDDGYRSHYTRPVYAFYERLLGRAISRDEWDAIDRTFHDVYRAALSRAGPAVDAGAALDLVARTPEATQSLLSMWWHDELALLVRSLGLARYLVRIDGNRGNGGEVKTAHLEEHVAKLETDLGTILAPSNLLVIGDSFDDFSAASELGLPCVLYDGGSHHRHELEETGVPIADSLVEALRLGGIAG